MVLHMYYANRGPRSSIAANGMLFKFPESCVCVSGFVRCDCVDSLATHNKLAADDDSPLGEGHLFPDLSHGIPAGILHCSVMNLVQMSRSHKSFLFKASRPKARFGLEGCCS